MMSVSMTVAAVAVTKHAVAAVAAWVPMLVSGVAGPLFPVVGGMMTCVACVALIVVLAMPMCAQAAVMTASVTQNAGRTHALCPVPLPQTIAFYGQSRNKLCAENLLSKSVNGDQHTPITSARLEQDGRLACIPEHAAALRNGSGVLATYAGTSETVHNSMRQFCLLASVVANGAQCWSALTRDGKVDVDAQATTPRPWRILLRFAGTGYCVQFPFPSMAREKTAMALAAELP
ncbi:hypothetical protein AK812_SmicGene44621 [Symbiodinium microadriaticum]|uniref:Uncharacterized protein n=1 Tax=Symbiodinium microadriaticum TaxID=2951 RepID=A0A1Q9BY06_SYMMI|nr:hypothetical protein AK812_SmicGene44621 [Symbiodinium microadriaticum]